MDNQDMLQNGQRSGEQTEEKTFSQQEVERMIQDRLARERRRAAKEQDNDTVRVEREKELEARELKMTAREKLFDAGLPTSLADVLKYQDEESLSNAIDVILNLNSNSKASDKGSWGQRQSQSKSKKTEEEQIREAMSLVR